MLIIEELTTNLLLSEESTFQAKLKVLQEMKIALKVD